MNAAFDLLPLLFIAVLPVMFIIQFFSSHSRKAAWAAPARATAPVVVARPLAGNPIDLAGARAARTGDTRSVPVAA